MPKTTYSFWLPEITHKFHALQLNLNQGIIYIHIIRFFGTCKLYSYNMEVKTMTVSSLPCPDLPPWLWPNHSTVWAMPESRYSYCSVRGFLISAILYVCIY